MTLDTTWKDLKRNARRAGFSNGFYAAFVHVWNPMPPPRIRVQGEVPGLTAPVGEDSYVPAVLFGKLRRFHDYDKGAPDGVLVDPIGRLLTWKRVDGPKNSQRHRPQFQQVLEILRVTGFVEPQGPEADPWASVRLLDKTPPSVEKPTDDLESEAPGVDNVWEATLTAG